MIEILSPAHIQAGLAELPEWRLRDGAIERHFKFTDFEATMAFVNAVADVARRQDHHPSLTVNFADCRVRYATHRPAGITREDFIAAAQVDRLAP